MYRVERKERENKERGREGGKKREREGKRGRERERERERKRERELSYEHASPSARMSSGLDCVTLESRCEPSASRGK